MGSRIYKRGDRYWGDFRALGGKREPLVAPGDVVATTDPEVADALVLDRVRELQQRHRSRVLLGIEEPAPLGTYASRHLVKKKKSKRFTESHMTQVETHLRRACEYFDAGRDLASISVDDVQAFTEWLGQLPGRKGETLSPGTVRHHLNSLSNLYKRAASERRVPPGFNPVRDMMDNPSGKPREAEWLEVPEAALLLESARRYRPRVHRSDHLPFMYPLIGAWLLTGGRPTEVLGLEVPDVSFDRRTVTFRPNQHRRIKTQAGWRTVKLWPQLEEILKEYVFGGDAPLADGLLFPSPRTGGLVRDVRKSLDAIAEKAGWKAGEIRPRMFRHTYAAARLQTLDHGAPVSAYTVAKELGHGGDGLVKRIYGHLGEVRHRGGVVEYRIENHQEELRDRLRLIA
jgi:integrase